MPTRTTLIALALILLGIFLPNLAGSLAFMAGAFLLAVINYIERQQYIGTGWIAFATAEILGLLGAPDLAVFIAASVGIGLIVYGMGRSAGEQRAWRNLLRVLANDSENQDAIRRARNIAKGRYFSE
ncbi:hypothetical protein [Glutamicibacter sp. 2E12]|uniref:hypothetical protein n=1 Tax=Glutamicibacter sp. 2E12 TaxID=3416181 RepID=UPI003CFB43C3